MERLVKKIEKRFGDIKPVFGKEHDYLGMGIKFGNEQSFEINMSSHIKEAIEIFEKVFNKDVS